MTAPFVPHAGARDPARLLDHTLQCWGGRGDVWVFGYASLIWRPEFEAVEERPATVHGWHRALAMRSRINRGTPGMSGPRLRARSRRLVPRARVPHRAAARRVGAAPLVDARDAIGRLRPEMARLPHPARHRPRPRLHAQPAQPEPHRAPPRRRAARDLQDARTAATAARWRIWSRPRNRCAPAASATATSSGWSRWRAATR